MTEKSERATDIVMLTVGIGVAVFGFGAMVSGGAGELVVGLIIALVGGALAYAAAQ